MEDMPTIPDMAQEMGLPPTTMRGWAKRHAAYLPCERDGRSTRYKPRAVEAFTLIAELYAAKKSANTVDAALADRYGETHEARQPATTKRQQGAAMLAETIRGALAEPLAGIEAELRGQSQGLQALVARLQTENASLNARLDESERREEAILRRLDAQSPPASISARLRRLVRSRGL